MAACTLSLTYQLRCLIGVLEKIETNINLRLLNAVDVCSLLVHAILNKYNLVVKLFLQLVRNTFHQNMETTVDVRTVWQ